MVSKKKIEIMNSSDEEEASENLLNINKNYADRYNTWRGKEELQRLKDKYGNVDNLDDEESSTDESEDDDAKELTEDVEKDFFKTLSMVKSRDSKIYDKNNCTFFDSVQEEDDSENETSKTKKTKKEDKKQFLLKDLEREMILKRMSTSGDNLENTNIYDDDENYNENANNTFKKGYFEEQDEIKKSLNEAIKTFDSDEEEDNDFLKVKDKSKEDEQKEEADYIEWLKGKKNKLQDPEVEKNMKYLHDYWNDPKLASNEKYLRDYILNKRYLSKEDDEDEDDDDDAEKDLNEIQIFKDKEPKLEQPLDYVDLSEEEKIVENQEQFERKFNFRFEEPDPEFIKSYPRTVADSMRRKDTKRKEKREEYKQRKDLEKQKKKEEIKRLKSLKRKEIVDKLEKLKKITGNFDLKLGVDDLEKDFDPEEYERKMEAVFNDDYYQQPDPEINNNDPDNEDDKPVFTDDDEEDLKYENWDEWTKQNTQKEENQEADCGLDVKNKKKKKKKKNDEDELQDPDFNMDDDFDESNQPKSKKKGKLAEALLKKKPVFDPKEKSFEEYFEEYYKLDCEDVIGGDLPCRFKYREVVPNDFGLTVEEILSSKDTELNQWASLKKTIQYRPIQDEIADSKAYKHKKDQIDLKKKVLLTYYNADEADAEESEDEVVQTENVIENDQKEKSAQEENEKRKEQHTEKEKKKSKKLKTSSDDDDEANKKRDEEGEKLPLIKESKSKSKDTEKVKDLNKIKKKKKNKNVIESLTDERLAAYGINPKKFKKKVKYSGKNAKTQNNE